LFGRLGLRARLDDLCHAAGRLNKWIGAQLQQKKRRRGINHGGVFGEAD
jgi:hypothetical protein